MITPEEMIEIVRPRDTSEELNLTDELRGMYDTYERGQLSKWRFSKITNDAADEIKNLRLVLEECSAEIWGNKDAPARLDDLLGRVNKLLMRT